MPTHHIASWLLKRSDVPLAVLKPVATRIGVSTNHLGAALFAGQLIYENQGAIVEYVDRGGVRVGRFLHRRASERYGEDHALTEYLGENVAALDEAFEGTEEEAVTFAEFYRRLRAVDRDASSVTLVAGLRDAAEASANAVSERAGGATGRVRGVTDSVDAVTGAVGGVKETVGEVTEAVDGVTEAVGDGPDRLRNLRSKTGSDSEADAVDIPVSNAE